jgi:hypothetical protein
MAFAYANNIDARNATINNAGGDQTIFRQCQPRAKLTLSLIILNRTDGQDILDKLEPVTMDASKRIECLPDTRSDILKFIINWVHDPAAQHNMLWVHGLAGSGKSTLSTTIANIFRDSGQLGAFLFFDRDVTERSNPMVVIKTLAHQLGTSNPRIGSAIRTTIGRNQNMLTSPLQRQFQKLVIDPLSEIEHFTPKLVIVFDALDECGTTEERDTLLAVLAHDFANIPLAIRTIITSRADSDIQNVFESRQHILAYELDITSTDNSDDILSYFRHCMSLIRTKNRHLKLAADWPGERVFHRLVERASGLFVWASTASQFINGHDPRKRLDVILSGGGLSGAEGALDVLYKTALESAGNWNDEDFVADFRNIMGVILLAREPLSSTAIDALLDLSEDRPSIHTISILGCVLQQSPTVRVLHPSFPDFLMMQDRCARDIWFFDRSTYHHHLALRCLDRMDAVLKQNMCNMTLTVDITTESLPEDVSYSCTFWIYHICAIEDYIMSIVERLRLFLFRHLLHWFEAMSILRRSGDTISYLNRLLDWTSVSHCPAFTPWCRLL